VSEKAVVYDGLIPVTMLLVDDHFKARKGHNPSLSISFKVECVDSCDYSASVKSWIVDLYENPLGNFTRTFLLFKGALYFDGSHCEIVGKYYHEPGWVFQSPAFTKRELVQLVKEWTWLWIGVAIGNETLNITRRVLPGNWYRYWTYEYTWLTTLAICSSKPYMTKWEIMNITNNALTTFLPTAIIHTKLWNNTKWIIIATALSKTTPRTFTIWHYTNRSSYRIVIVDPLLYEELCAGNRVTIYKNIHISILKRLNFNVIGLS